MNTLISGDTEMTTVLPRNETTGYLRRRPITWSHFSDYLKNKIFKQKFEFFPLMNFYLTFVSNKCRDVFCKPSFLEALHNAHASTIETFWEW